VDKTTQEGPSCTVFLTKYHSGDQVKKIEMDRACSTNEASRGAYRVLVEKPEGSRPPGNPRRRWEDNNKMALREMGWGHGLDLSGS
jgi:hypothetical protein